MKNIDESRMRKIFPAAIVYFLFLFFNMASSRGNMLPSHLKLNSALTCRLVGGMTRDQRAFCQELPDAVSIAFEGLQLAVKECQHQFRWHRWNCSSLAVKSSNPHSSAIMKRGFRESAFLYALTAAGVAHAIARACAQGRLLSCGCDPLGYRASHDPRGRARPNKWEWSGCSHNLAYGIEFSRKFLDVREQVDDLQSKINVHNNNAGRSVSFFDLAPYMYARTGTGISQAIARACAEGRLLSCGCDSLGYRASHDPRGRARPNKWEWSGCSHNLAYGIEFSRKFLDVREQVDDLQSKINVHNNNAGRSILSSQMEVRCKCHGLSGSCQLRTCWRATPDFRVVASTIKRQYRKALMVAQEELNNGLSVLRGRPRGRRKSRAKPAPKTSLLFFEKSPSFCDADPKTDSAGTSGRVCRMGRTSRAGSCDLLCCGRGHALLRKSSIKPCNCTFHWCCRVDCQRCKDEKWIAVCK